MIVIGDLSLNLDAKKCDNDSVNLPALLCPLTLVLQCQVIATVSGLIRKRIILSVGSTTSNW